jgi:PAS domain S-box-containing protein
MGTNFSSKKKAKVKNTRKESELLNEIQKLHLFGAWEWQAGNSHFFWSDSMFFLHGLLPSSDNLISIEAANNMIHPSDISLVQQQWKELEKTGSADYFFRVILPEGKIKQLHAYSKAFRKDETNYIYRGSYQEESGQATRSLQDELIRQSITLNIFERAEQIGQMGTWQINLNTFETFYSDNIFRLYGLDPHSLPVHVDTFLKFIHQEDRDIVLNAFERSYQEKIPIHLEYRIITTKEEIRFIKQVSKINKNEKGEQVITGTTHDITEKKMLESELQELNDKIKLDNNLFQQAQQIGRIGISVLNLNTRKVEYSNNIYSIYGIKPQSIPATPETLLPYIHPDDRASFTEASSLIYEGQISPMMEFRIIGHDGKTRTLRQFNQRTTNHLGEDLITSLIQDITERHSTNSLLKVLNQQYLLQTEAYSQAEKIVGVGSWFWNLNSDKIKFSDHVFHIHGLKSGSLETSIDTFRKLIHPEDKKIFEDTIERIKKGESHIECEYRVIRTDGDVRYLRNRNKLICTLEDEKISVGTIQDITHEVLLSQQLAERTDFTEILSDTILDTIIVTDSSNNILTCNSQCEKAHSFKKQEVFRKNIFDVFPQLKNPEMVENFRKALQGKTIHLHATKSVIFKGYHNVLMQPLKNKKEEIIGVLMVLHDVTQEYLLQYQLKERLNFIEKLVESSIDRIIVLDTHLNYLIWNKNCENYYNIKKENILGKNVLELFPMFKVDPIYQECRKALNGEYRHIPVRKNNDNNYSESFLIPLTNGQAEVTAILWIIHDVSEIMQAKEKLASSEEHLKTAQEIAHLGSWEYEPESGRLTWSEELYRVYGYEPGSFDPTIEFHINTSHPDNRNDIKLVFSDPEKIHSFINKVSTLDGRTRYLQTFSRPVLGKSGSLLKIIATVQDITEQKILQDQVYEKTVAVRKQYDKIHQAEMMGNVSTWQLNLQTGDNVFQWYIPMTGE